MFLQNKISLSVTMDCETAFHDISRMSFSSLKEERVLSRQYDHSISVWPKGLLAGNLGGVMAKILEKTFGRTLHSIRHRVVTVSSHKSPTWVGAAANANVPAGADSAMAQPPRPRCSTLGWPWTRPRNWSTDRMASLRMLAGLVTANNPEGWDRRTYWE